MDRAKNITRYEAARGASYSFKGWRLCISRQKTRFVRYFSDREHAGDSAAALAAALEMRNAILGELAREGATPAVVFASFRKMYP